MRFGAFVPQGWRLDLVDVPVEDQWSTMVNVATTIERTGYESLWVFDHFHTVPVPTQEVTYEAWTLMAALAAVTDTVRLGQMCTCNGYRSPSYLAKVASSIDAISGGRVEMGIGAGWYEHEFLAYGYDFPKPSVRIGQLGDAVEIMKRMWTDDEATYEGKYFSVSGAICQPKPVQAPHIPLWIAGGGEQLTLRIVAKHAQYANYGGDLDNFVHKQSVLNQHCAAVGRDPTEIVRSSNFTVFCVEDAAEANERMAWLRSMLGRFVPEADIDARLARQGIDAKTPDQLVEMFKSWQSEGLDYAIVNFPDAAYDQRGIELFAKDVMPQLRT